MGQKRSRLGIIQSILESVRDSNGKIKQTKLMYKANLSHTQMKIYLNDLVSKKLIREEEKEPYKYYILTEKGFSFLQNLNRMRHLEKFFNS